MKRPKQAESEENTEGRVLARLREKMCYELDIDRTTLMLLAEQWSIGKNDGVAGDASNSMKNNINKRIVSSYLTFKKLVELLDVMGFKDIEVVINGTMPDGQVYTASEMFSFSDGKSLNDKLELEEGQVIFRATDSDGEMKEVIERIRKKKPMNSVKVQTDAKYTSEDAVALIESIKNTKVSQGDE